MNERVVVNIGSGHRDSERLPSFFGDWRQLRVDADPNVRPDVVADATDLSALQNSMADAIWCAHCLEHLYVHDVPRALSEFRRLLKEDGFVAIMVPDLQTVAREIVADRMDRPLYESEAGPITPHDIVFGYGPAIAEGQLFMAHRCGFTPTLLLNSLQAAGFPHIVVRRKPTWELLAVARAIPFLDEEARETLVNAL
jgi:hypothetical protein